MSGRRALLVVGGWSRVGFRTYVAGNARAPANSSDSLSKVERLKWLRARVEESKRFASKAEHEVDKATAQLRAVEAESSAPRAHDSVDRAATIVAQTAAMAAESDTARLAENNAAAASLAAANSARFVAFSFGADVKARLGRPLSEWRADETFEVTGIKAAVRAPWHWHETVLLSAESLAVLCEWERTPRMFDGSPSTMFHGSPGSTPMQLVALRALANGDPVLLFVWGEMTLIEVVDGATLRVERLTNVAQLGEGGRPDMMDTVFCYDSLNGLFW